MRWSVHKNQFVKFTFLKTQFRIFIPHYWFSSPLPLWAGGRNGEGLCFVGVPPKKVFNSVARNGKKYKFIFHTPTNETVAETLENAPPENRIRVTGGFRDVK